MTSQPDLPPPTPSLQPSPALSEQLPALWQPEYEGVVRVTPPALLLTLARPPHALASRSGCGLRSREQRGPCSPPEVTDALSLPRRAPLAPPVALAASVPAPAPRRPPRRRTVLTQGFGGRRGKPSTEICGSLLIAVGSAGGLWTAFGVSGFRLRRAAMAHLASGCNQRTFSPSGAATRMGLVYFLRNKKNQTAKP